MDGWQSEDKVKGWEGDKKKRHNDGMLEMWQRRGRMMM